MLYQKKSRDEKILNSFREKFTELGIDVAIEGEVGSSEEGNKKRVLAVDDSKSILLFYRHVFSNMGMSVETAENGSEGLEILKEDSSFDLIILDMNMPVMDGIDMARNLKDDFMLSEIPIIMVTSESETAQTALAEKVGVNKFLVKPLNESSFREEIEAFFKSQE